jgi:restriction system protein
MALWLTRAGKRGEWEQKFLDESRVYLTWEGLNRDLTIPQSTQELGELLREVYPNAPKGRISQNTGQIWAFAKRMKVGDWFVLPSKMKPAIHVGEITGEYEYDPNAADPCFHHRKVKWIETDVPRTNFDQDLLYSFGAFSTVCQVKRNDAEQRIHLMAKNGWKSSGPPPLVVGDDSDLEDGETGSGVDLERLARDRIAKVIASKFKGHGMALLVEAVLSAQGYTTYRSPEGPDKGIDILAALGPLGFGQPRIAVQVKSGDSAIDRPTLDQLIGAMQNVQADQGLLVSWGGFKTSVDREKATQFFRVRLWDQDTLIGQILANYDKLDDELRADLPLKRIWTVTEQEDAAEAEES